MAMFTVSMDDRLARLKSRNLMQPRPAGGRYPVVLNGQRVMWSRTGHDRMLRHITELLDASAEVRDASIEKYTAVDRSIASYIKLSADDQKRARDNRLGRGVKPTDTVLPMTFGHLEDMVTFLLTLLAPDEGIYSAIAPREQQDIATGFASLMNKQAESYGHYANLARFLFNSLKYNLSYATVLWARTYGNRIVSLAGALDVEKNVVVNQGNAINNVNIYNALADPTVRPTELPTYGEFFGQVCIEREFRLARMIANGEIAAPFEDDLSFGEYKWYQETPVVRADLEDMVVGGDWDSILTAATQASSQFAGIEFCKTLLFVNAADFGVPGIKRPDGFSVWYVHHLSDRRIVSLRQLDNAHGLLPVIAARPNDDDLGAQTKSVAEYLEPFNTFASHQMNVHQRAARKALVGVTYYNRRAVTFGQQDEEDATAGRVPVQFAYGADADVRKAVTVFNTGPDTRNSVEDLSRMSELMELTFPSRQLQQVASLDRATQYHAAATVQASSRRLLKIAKILNTQAMVPARHMMMYNILELQPQMEILSPEGRLITVDPRQFRDSDLEFRISDGLAGLDKLTLVISIKEVLNSILQSEQAFNRFDVAAIIDYWTSLIGDKTDFKQFLIVHPLDSMPREVKDTALQLLQAQAQSEQAA